MKAPILFSLWLKALGLKYFAAFLLVTLAMTLGDILDAPAADLKDPGGLSRSIAA